MSRHTFGTILPGSLRVKIDVQASRIDGRGIFARESIRRRQKIGSLAGELVSVREGRRRAHGRKRIALVELGDGRAVDASEHGNEFRYINHSCGPNAFMRTIGVHVEFYALRRIAPGEEITCDYGETHHDGTLPCRCGADNCRSAI